MYRHLFPFRVYAGEGMEHIGTESLSHSKAAHWAGIFRCQVLGGNNFGNWGIDPHFVGGKLIDVQAKQMR